MKAHIDPFQYINYNRTSAELEVFLLFCVAVAGKTAKTIAPKVNHISDESLKRGFTGILQFASKNPKEFLEVIKKHKLGKYKLFYKFTHWFVKNEIDLRNSDSNQLEMIPGIGMKSSRYFIMGNKKVDDIAALDTHVLKHLRKHKVENVPTSTPSKKEYLRLEKEFIKLFKEAKSEEPELTLAEYDFRIWKSYTK